MDGDDAFLSAVDQAEAAIRAMATGDQSGLAAAERVLSTLEAGHVTKDRTLINKTPSTPSSDAPVSQAQFMQELERDANERAARRRVLDKEAEELKTQGNDAFRKGHYARALELYEAALQKAPANVALHTNRAQTHLRLGEPGKALESCDLALRLDAENAKAHLRRGVALMELGRLEEAEAALQTALMHTPASLRGEVDEHLRRVLILREDKASMARGDAHARENMQQATARLLDGHWQDAVPRLVTLIANDSTNQDLFRTCGGLGIVSSLSAASPGLAEVLRLLLAATRDNRVSRARLAESLDALVALAATALSVTVDAAAPLAALLEHLTRHEPSARKHKGLSDCLMAVFACDTHWPKQCVATVLLALAHCIPDAAKTRDRLARQAWAVCEPLLQHGDEACGAVLAIYLALSLDASAREVVSADSTLVPGLLRLAARNGGSHRLNVLGVLVNLSTDTHTVQQLQSQRAAIIDALAAGGHDPEMVARLVTLVARMLTTSAVADDCAARVLPRLVLLISDPASAAALQADVMRCFARMLQLSPRASGALLEPDMLTKALRFVQSSHGALAGNTALFIAEAARVAKVCEFYATSDIVARLLAHAKKDKCALQENAAIALARLAQGSSVLLGHLREQRGLEILHARTSA